jgi:hypothetical protein
MPWRRLAAICSPLAALIMLIGALTVPVAAAAAATTVSLSEGTARTVDVPGGGYLVVHEFGAISMVNADGQTSWRYGSQSLYKDWDLSWEDASGSTPVPQLAWGTNAINPLEFTGAGTGLLNDVNPAAAGYLDGSLDVAVAETVGSNMTTESPCAECYWPFDEPGSSLHLGTFVAVFNVRTGRMIYHELVPGYVTQLAIGGNRLIVGDETGDPQNEYNDIGAWGSVSTVTGLSVSPDGVARQAWKYSTGSEWGRLLDMSVTDAGLALAWSDTPEGLGVPGPPDGHVLLFDATTGAIRWKVSTTGYPVLTAADDQRRELAVVDLTDPTVSIGYTLTGLRYSNGSAEFSTQVSGALPISFAVGDDGDGWAIGAVRGTVDDGEYVAETGQVTFADPATGKVVWSRTQAQTDGYVPVPGGVVVTGGEVVAGSWITAVAPTASEPVAELNSVTAYGYRSGDVVWSHTGDPGDPMSLTAVTRGPGLVRAVNSDQDVETYSAGGATSAGTGAGPGSFISGVAVGDDLVAGNQDGDVYAFSGRSLSAVLWRTQLPGPVHQIVRATLDGREVLIAAATSAVAVLDARTGHVLTIIKTAGAYAYTVTEISAGSVPAVVVPGSSLTAYALANGKELWSYAAPSGAAFSDAAYSDGVVAAEYTSAASAGESATEMAAIGLTATTGKLAWSAAADPSVVQSGELWNGTLASPYIAGASGDGVAFAWEDTDGDGQVDVRDIATGKLLYSDSSSDLSYFTEFLASPGTGLIGVSQTGSALITPAGAESTGAGGGTSATLADGYLVTANAGVNVYSTDIFTDSSATALTSDTTYYSGTVVSLGTNQIVEMSPDALAYQIVNAEAGYTLFAPYTADQQGLAVLTLTSSSASSGNGTKAPAATSLPVPGWSKTIPASLRPVGQVGSTAPVTGLARSGAAVPEMSPSDVKHSSSATLPAGYSPAQLEAYLGLTGQVASAGAGETIAIVDAYDDPDIASDAETFSEEYGLPGVCGAGGKAGDCFRLDVKQQSASAGSDADWALETSLDVEWTHAIAPKATIELVEASTATFAALFAAVNTAAASHPAAVSMSWGLSSGEFSEETYYDHFCQVTTTVCVVSAGDYGHPGDYPAYNPSVVAVGGTTLTLSSDGSVTSEVAWSGSGGGQSWVEPEPSYQKSVQSSGKREMPDVSFEADPNTGVAVYDSVPYYGESGWWEVGGTSVGAPSWSAILADADQFRAANGKAALTAADDDAQQAIYSLSSSALARITTGADNGFCPVGCTPATGYDEITGLGSPRGGVVAALAAARLPMGAVSARARTPRARAPRSRLVVVGHTGLLRKARIAPRLAYEPL